MELFIALILTAIFLLIVIFPFICFFLLKKLQNHIYEIESQLKLIHDHLLISPEESLKTAAAENIFNPAQETADDSDNFADDILRSPQSAANDTDEIKNSALAINDAGATAIIPSGDFAAFVEVESVPESDAQSSPAPGKFEQILEKHGQKINASIASFEERTAAVLKRIWNWLCVGEEFRSPGLSREYALATTWLIRLGVIILLCGIGFFLKYSIDHNWTPPAVRVIMMMIAGLAMAGLGSWKSSGRYRPLAIAVSGGGFVTLYLSIMAACNLYDLISPSIAFCFMTAVTIGAMASALGTNALLTALLGCTGGYLTPVFISTGSNNITALLIYMTILGCGTVLTARYRNWVLLNTASFVFYALIAGLALSKYAPDTAMGSVLAIILLTINYLIFNLQQILAAQRRDMSIIEAILFGGNLIFYLAASLPGASRFLADWKVPSLIALVPALAAVLAIFYFKHIRQPWPPVLRIFLQIQLCFALALTIPLLLGNIWIIAAWSLLAFLLIEAAIKLQSRTLLALAVILYIFTGLKLITGGNVFDNINTDNYLNALINHLLTAGTYILFLTAGGIRLLNNPSSFRNENSGTSAEFVEGLGQLFSGAAALMFFIYSSYELVLAMKSYFFIFQHGILVLYWSLLGGVLAHLLYRLKNMKFIYLSVLLIFLSGIWLLSMREPIAIRSEYWYSLIFTLFTAGIYIACLSWVGRALYRSMFIEDIAPQFRSRLRWLAIICYSLSGILFLFYSSRELYELLQHYLPSFRNGGLSVYWSLLAIVLLFRGVKSDHKILRMCSISLFVTVALKIFFIDLAGLEPIWRIVAFAIIGIVMLIGAVFYIHGKDMFMNHREDNEQ